MKPGSGSFSSQDGESLRSSLDTRSECTEHQKEPIRARGYIPPAYCCWARAASISSVPLLSRYTPPITNSTPTAVKAVKGSCQTTTPTSIVAAEPTPPQMPYTRPSGRFCRIFISNVNVMRYPITVTKVGSGTVRPSEAFKQIAPVTSATMAIPNRTNARRFDFAFSRTSRFSSSATLMPKPPTSTMPRQQ